MGKDTKLGEARLRELEKRQSPPKFGADYKPSIMATRAEAPSISRAAQIKYKPLGRYIHALSMGERNAFILAAYHPGLWEVQEQRMLPYLPAEHPMALHERGKHKKWPILQGSIDVAERLGFLEYHPHFQKTVNGERCWVPFPFINDFLFFFNDEQGDYCLNWNVKATREGFSHKNPELLAGYKRSDVKDEKTVARHAIEKQLFSDADIRTVEIAANEIDPDVIANLTQIYLWHDKSVRLAKSVIDEVEQTFQAGLVMGIAPMETVFDLAVQHQCHTDTLKTIYFQMIWSRKLRVDLYTPILIDRPVYPERKDVLLVYSSWFGRAA